MASLEGMWAVYFGDVAGGQIPNSGIAVFETGKIFGGDSMMAYLGSYAGSSGELKVWAYNDYITVQTAFGKMGTPEGTNLKFSFDWKSDAGPKGMGEMVGYIWEADNPEAKIPAQLVKVAELP